MQCLIYIFKKCLIIYLILPDCFLYNRGFHQVLTSPSIQTCPAFMTDIQHTTQGLDTASPYSLALFLKASLLNKQMSYLMFQLSFGVCLHVHKSLFKSFLSFLQLSCACLNYVLIFFFWYCLCRLSHWSKKFQPYLQHQSSYKSLVF